jgi:hypothetical protein
MWRAIGLISQNFPLFLRTEFPSTEGYSVDIVLIIIVRGPPPPSPCGLRVAGHYFGWQAAMLTAIRNPSQSNPNVQAALFWRPHGGIRALLRFDKPGNSAKPYFGLQQRAWHRYVSFRSAGAIMTVPQAFRPAARLAHNSLAKLYYSLISKRLAAGFFAICEPLQTTCHLRNTYGKTRLEPCDSEVFSLCVQVA